MGEKQGMRGADRPTHDTVSEGDQTGRQGAGMAEPMPADLILFFFFSIGGSI
jgi:hypothetical protein